MSRLSITLRGGDKIDTVKQVLQALSETGTLYNQSGQLVEVETHDSGIDLRQVNKARLRILIDSVVALDRGDPSRCIEPPVWLVEGVLSSAPWKPLQSLRGLTRLPLLDSQGQLIYERGYHAESGWYSDPNIEPQKLVEPLGSAELKRSWRLLFNSYFGEFPWVSKEHKAAYSALIVALVARVALPRKVGHASSGRTARDRFDQGCVPHITLSI